MRDPSADPATSGARDPAITRRLAVAIGCLLAVAALAIYAGTYVDRYYDHFVWQAAAFLEGHAAIRYPVEAANGSNGNAYFQDVLPIATSDGVARGLLPFPPLPAVVLLPFVALWGLATNDQAIFTVLVAVDVAICWWVIGRLPVEPRRPARDDDLLRASARSSGSPRSSRRPGTRRTSSRSG